MMHHVVLCACGLALHYSDPAVQAFMQRAIDQWGPTVAVSIPEGTWYVTPTLLRAPWSIGRVGPASPGAAVSLETKG